jgi:hypothetical protein
MRKDVEQRIAELGRMSDTRLKIEHAKVFCWEPLFEGRKEMIEKLTAHLRAQAAKPDSTTDTDEKE